jgi:UPF0755 protein
VSWRRLAIVTAAVAIVLAAAGWRAYRYYWVEPTPAFAPPRMVTVERGEPFRKVAHALARAGVVRSSLALMLYAQISGGARNVKPGDYAFKGAERIPDVMRHLVNGDFVVVTVTIPEGLTVHEIAERLEEAGLVCQDDFERAARDGRIVRALGLWPPGAEGYLFPATYRFSPRANLDDILTAMLARYYQVLTPRVEEQMFTLGLDSRRLVTMASIVEKEAKVPGERPLIAGVFYNRLRLGIPLQSDPTAEYSFEGENERPAAAVRSNTAFNTYAFAGLPPGPIANPGLRSIEAALYPAHTDFLYFVARDDGTHVFSRSFKEHRRAVALARKASEHRGGAAVRPEAGLNHVE